MILVAWVCLFLPLSARGYKHATTWEAGEWTGLLLPRVRASRALWILLGRHGRLHMATSVQLPQEATQRGEDGPCCNTGASAWEWGAKLSRRIQFPLQVIPLAHAIDCGRAHRLSPDLDIGDLADPSCSRPWAVRSLVRASHQMGHICRLAARGPSLQGLGFSGRFERLGGTDDAIPVLSCPVLFFQSLPMPCPVLSPVDPLPGHNMPRLPSVFAHHPSTAYSAVSTCHPAECNPRAY